MRAPADTAVNPGARHRAAAHLHGVLLSGSFFCLTAKELPGDRSALHEDVILFRILPLYLGMSAVDIADALVPDARLNRNGVVGRMSLVRGCRRSRRVAAVDIGDAAGRRRRDRESVVVDGISVPRESSRECGDAVRSVVRICNVGIFDLIGIGIDEACRFYGTGTVRVGPQPIFVVAYASQRAVAVIRQLETICSVDVMTQERNFILPGLPAAPCFELIRIDMNARPVKIRIGILREREERRPRRRSRGDVKVDGGKILDILRRISAAHI